MPPIPRRTKSSKVGTNLKNADARSALRKRELDAASAKYRKAQEAFKRRRNQILTKPVVRKLAPTVQAIREEFAQAALQAGGGLEKVAAAKRRGQKAMTAALKKAVPRFSELQRLAAAHAKNHGTLVAQDVAAAAGELLPITLGDFEPLALRRQTFTAPYVLFDVTTFEIDAELFVFNESFVDLGTGMLVSNFHFQFNEDRPGFYRILPHQRLTTSVGVFVTVPATGFLTISTVIENLFNKIDVAVRDNFGISHSDVTFDVRLFIEIVRAGQSTVRTRTMLHGGLTSHGSDLSFSRSDIPDQTPFTLKFNPHDAFVKGEVIQVMVGSQVNIDIDADDMQSFVNALLWWQVKKIVVGMKA